MRRLFIHSANYLSKLFLLFIMLCLVGCQSRVRPIDDIDLPKLPERVEGASDKQIMLLQTRLNNHGARVITIGQDYLVTIPSRLLFARQSSRLTWESYALLNDVVCYLREFRKVNVNITAFTSKYIFSARDHVLSLARANAVADYIWSQDVDARFIFTQGLGSEKPDGAFKKYGDDSPVSRIEITFRRAVA